MDEITKKLAELRKPFAPNQIGRLPKPTKAQTDEVKRDFKKGVRCAECGGWHHPKVVHLDYVGHAALTDRLLDVDPAWDWEPLSISPEGLPVFDSIGGLWIRLTVCGVSRLGYGDAQGKTGNNAIKEAIGDALRNAGMRFGLALDLWHKGDLHEFKQVDDTPPPIKQPEKPKVDIFATFKAQLKKGNSFEDVMDVIDSDRFKKWDDGLSKENKEEVARLTFLAVGSHISKCKSFDEIMAITDSDRFKKWNGGLSADNKKVASSLVADSQERFIKK